MNPLTYFQNQNLSITQENNFFQENTALKIILESIWKINFFKNQFRSRERIHSFTSDDSLIPHDILRLSLINKLSLNPLQEPKGVFETFLYILEHLGLSWRLLKDLPLWNSHFEVNEMAKMICYRCKMATEYPVERSYGLIINANSIRETKADFEKSTFEDIVNFIRIDLKMPCDKEGCGSQSYVQRMISKLPTVFTIALEWDNDETEEEIWDTTSVLVPEIDISVIYQYEGDSEFTKYRLVSMVCSCGDQYNCVAYESERVGKNKEEKKRWVRHFGYQKEDTGEWDGVLSMFLELKMRPEILFFENIKQRDQIITEEAYEEEEEEEDKEEYKIFKRRR
ncbi:hypothetical protein V5N11_020119 [Cardamine amara subsp. amara]|uniref:Peptidase C19 ubiquitin carboxyl-terminal hydrolase domain-containing protein n=1 Tax=Cardamine amara subsp. amara TaxID=228776 RepID=A0ABD1AL42_CARAN